MSKYVIAGTVIMSGSMYQCHLARIDTHIEWRQSGEFIEFNDMDSAVNFIKSHKRDIMNLEKLYFNKVCVEEVIYQERYPVNMALL